MNNETLDIRKKSSRKKTTQKQIVKVSKSRENIKHKKRNQKQKMENIKRRMKKQEDRKTKIFKNKIRKIDKI